MIPKPLPRIVEKKQKRQAKMAALADAITAVYNRDRSKCRCCGTHVTRRASYAFQRGHVHHLRFRSRGGRNNTANLALMCGICHQLIHGYRITVTGSGDGMLTFSREGGHTWKSSAV